SLVTFLLVDAVSIYRASDHPLPIVLLLYVFLCFLFSFLLLFFFNDTPTTEIYTLSLHDALPICRLHFHAVHFMRTLPTGSVDPNFGRRVRNRRQLNSLQNTWPYGYSMPIAVRYTQDAFSRSGWLWPVDAKGEPLKATS